jgi:hypothetical protein
MLEAAGVSFDDAVADRQAATDDHNRRETALYAQSLERKALALGVARAPLSRGLGDAELPRSRQQKTRFLPRNYNRGIEDAYLNALSERNFR